MSARCSRHSSIGASVGHDRRARAGGAGEVEVAEEIVAQDRGRARGDPPPLEWGSGAPASRGVGESRSPWRCMGPGAAPRVAPRAMARSSTRRLAGLGEAGPRPRGPQDRWARSLRVARAWRASRFPGIRGRCLAVVARRRNVPRGARSACRDGRGAVPRAPGAAAAACEALPPPPSRPQAPRGPRGAQESLADRGQKRAVALAPASRPRSTTSPGAALGGVGHQQSMVTLRAGGGTAPPSSASTPANRVRAVSSSPRAAAKSACAAMPAPRSGSGLVDPRCRGDRRASTQANRSGSLRTHSAQAAASAGPPVGSRFQLLSGVDATHHAARGSPSGTSSRRVNSQARAAA